MSKVNKTQYAVLGMLSISPMSGYEIRQTMQESTANFWAESDGQLYPALTKLAKEGYISGKKEMSENNREKKIYRLTTKGREELKNWLMQESDKQVVRSEFMLKLFFGANVLPQISREHIEAHRYQTKSALLQLKETKKQLENEQRKSQHLPYWLMSIQYGMDIADAKLKWCDNVINTLNKMKTRRKS